MTSGDSLSGMVETSHKLWPKLSVIVATYKRPQLLRRALDSVLAQTYRDMEVIVVHDGPTDADTEAVYDEYGPMFDAAGIDFIDCASDSHTGYYTYPRNVAIQYCRGSYIANLDDDNEWTPDALNVLMAAIEEDEQWPDLVYGRRRYVIDAGAPAEINGRPISEFAGESPLVEITPESMLGLATAPQYNFIDSSDFIVSKGAMFYMLVTTGMMWNEGVRRFGDYELIARGLHLVGWQAKPVDHIVQLYHIHGDQVSLTRNAREMPDVKVSNG